MKEEWTEERDREVSTPRSLGQISNLPSPSWCHSPRDRKTRYWSSGVNIFTREVSPLLPNRTFTTLSEYSTRPHYRWTRVGGGDPYPRSRSATDGVSWRLASGVGPGKSFSSSVSLPFVCMNTQKSPDLTLLVSHLRVC